MSCSFSFFPLSSTCHCRSMASAEFYILHDFVSFVSTNCLPSPRCHPPSVFRSSFLSPSIPRCPFRYFPCTLVAVHSGLLSCPLAVCFFLRPQWRPSLLLSPFCLHSLHILKKLGMKYYLLFCNYIPSVHIEMMGREETHYS